MTSQWGGSTGGGGSGSSGSGGEGSSSASERFLRRLMEDPEGVDLPNFERPSPNESQHYSDDSHDSLYDSRYDSHDSQDSQDSQNSPGCQHCHHSYDPEDSAWRAMPPVVAWVIHTHESWDVERGIESVEQLPPPQMLVVPPQQRRPPMYLLQPAARAGAQPQLFVLYRGWQRTPQTKRKFPKGAIYIPVATTRRRTE